MRHHESALQTSCVNWFREIYPDKIIFANANGGKRNAKEAARMKREGVTAGVPDLTICAYGYTLFVELKSQNGRLSENQKAMIDKMKENLLTVFVVYSIDEFMEQVTAWMEKKYNDLPF